MLADAATQGQLPGWAWPAMLAGGILLLVIAVRTRTRKPQRDPQRVFNQQQRAYGFSRAGNRCENFSFIGRRCKRPPTQGDHIFPWSKGGATSMDNFGALCRKCNARKSAKIMSRLYIARLERRRRKYFPVGEPVRVVYRTSRR